MSLTFPNSYTSRKAIILLSVAYVIDLICIFLPGLKLPKKIFFGGLGKTKISINDREYMEIIHANGGLINEYENDLCSDKHHLSSNVRKSEKI